MIIMNNKKLLLKKMDKILKMIYKSILMMKLIQF